MTHDGACALQLANVHRFDWKTEPSSEGASLPSGRTSEEIVANSKSFAVTISPMEIRTWSCFYHRV
jgi:hypothetical protein